METYLLISESPLSFGSRAPARAEWQSALNLLLSPVLKCPRHSSFSRSWQFLTGYPCPVLISWGSSNGFLLLKLMLGRFQSAAEGRCLLSRPPGACDSYQCINLHHGESVFQTWSQPSYYFKSIKMRGVGFQRMFQVAFCDVKHKKTAEGRVRRDRSLRAARLFLRFSFCFLYFLLFHN